MRGEHRVISLAIAVVVLVVLLLTAGAEGTLGLLVAVGFLSVSTRFPGAGVIGGLVLLRGLLVMGMGMILGVIALFVVGKLLSYAIGGQKAA